MRLEEGVRVARDQRMGRGVELRAAQRGRKAPQQLVGQPDAPVVVDHCASWRRAARRAATPRASCCRAAAADAAAALLGGLGQRGDGLGRADLPQRAGRGRCRMRRGPERRPPFAVAQRLGQSLDGLASAQRAKRFERRLVDLAGRAAVLAIADDVQEQRQRALVAQGAEGRKNRVARRAPSPTSAPSRAARTPRRCRWSRWRGWPRAAR